MRGERPAGPHCVHVPQTLRKLNVQTLGFTANNAFLALKYKYVKKKKKNVYDRESDLRYLILFYERKYSN